MGAFLDELRAQHREAEQVLARLQAAVGALGNGDVAPATLAELQAVDGLIRTEVDHHFKTEEEVLFPAMARYMGWDGGPLAVMMMEHKEFWRLQEEYSKHVARLAGGDQGAAQAVAHAARGILNVLPPHIQKEDHILFPMAEQVLSPADWEELARARS